MLEDNFIRRNVTPNNDYISGMVLKFDFQEIDGYDILTINKQ